MDRHGGVFASSHYCDGRTVYPTRDGRATLTNHPLEPAATALRGRGYTGPEPGAFSFERLAQLGAWTTEHAGRATVQDARLLLGAGSCAGLVNNPNTAFTTIAIPQTHPHTLWLAQQLVTPEGLFAFDVRTGERVIETSGKSSG